MTEYEISIEVQLVTNSYDFLRNTVLFICHLWAYLNNLSVQVTRTNIEYRLHETKCRASSFR